MLLKSRMADRQTSAFLSSDCHKNLVLGWLDHITSEHCSIAPLRIFLGQSPVSGSSSNGRQRFSQYLAACRDDVSGVGNAGRKGPLCGRFCRRVEIQCRRMANMASAHHCHCHHCFPGVGVVVLIIMIMIAIFYYCNLLPFSLFLTGRRVLQGRAPPAKRLLRPITAGASRRQPLSCLTRDCTQRQPVGHPIPYVVIPIETSNVMGSKSLRGIDFKGQFGRRRKEG
jgi:hypothetical protein